MAPDVRTGSGSCNGKRAGGLGNTDIQIAIDNIEKMPVNAASMTFTRSGDGDTTPFTMIYDYEPKGGPLAFLLGPILDRQMAKGFHGFIDSLEPAAQARASA